ncbi:NUDIX hydrolase [Halobaculum sp. MBLA0147]|uniref:NUDIX hydrolase n=1 Tax=Halobaculum sp. MBLA0147 TaxID=3079934 RepID=UPI003523DC7C
MDEYGYVVNVDGAVYRDGEYLLIERAADEAHAAGVLGLPGGKLEAPPGERDALDATVRRELREEVGVVVDRVTVVASGTFETDDGTACLNVVCLCEYADGEARPVAADEVAGVEWVSLAALDERSDVPGYTERYLRDADEARPDRGW